MVPNWPSYNKNIKYDNNHEGNDFWKSMENSKL